MQPFARFSEELHLGVIIDPHTEQQTTLTEMVTVCPSCHSLNSLRISDFMIRCVECSWSTPLLEPIQAA